MSQDGHCVLCTNFSQRDSSVRAWPGRSLIAGVEGDEGTQAIRSRACPISDLICPRIPGGETRRFQPGSRSGEGMRCLPIPHGHKYLRGFRHGQKLASVRMSRCGRAASEQPKISLAFLLTSCYKGGRLMEQSVEVRGREGGFGYAGHGADNSRESNGFRKAKYATSETNFDRCGSCHGDPSGASGYY